MRTIGITGGVGTGKSTVLAFLKEEYNAFIIQADQVGHLVMEPGEECYEPVIRLFGKDIIKNDKTIDRRRVSDVVFTRQEMLPCLNEIIHPAVKRYILARLKEQEEKGCSLAFVEAALLFEDNYQEFLDEIWYIRTEPEIRISRLIQSRGYSRKKAISIMSAQASDDFFREHADFIIENNDNVEDTWQQIREGVRRNETL